MQENGTCAGIVLNGCGHGVSSLTRQFLLWKQYEKKLSVNFIKNYQLKKQHKFVKLLTIFFRASAGCVYMTNDRFTVALQYADTSIANNLDDIMSYVNNTGMVGFY